MDPHRAYRVLGVAPGSPKEDVRQAYRDLAQVWHPDRFPHSERLQAKAQRNLARINEAYEVLGDFEPPPGGIRRSRLSATMDTLRDLGDFMQSSVLQRPQPRPRYGARREVLGLGTIERSGVYERHHGRAPRIPAVGLALIGLILVAVIVLAVVLVVSN